MLQLYDLCRLCAQKKRNKMDLFTGGNDEEARVLLSKISLCLSVQVTREDLLPKMICVDCQKAVEQFNAFRVKCQKAEERLNKMLSSTLPNKLTVTRIKQEHFETDFLENSLQLKLDSPKCSDPISLLNLKSLKNVKSEVDESKWNEGNSSDLIQIISEEIVNQQCIDIKQPQIEIISENFEVDFKNIDLNEDEGAVCDVKVVPENLLRIEEANNGQYINPHIQNEVEDVFIKACDSDQEVFKPQAAETKKKVLVQSTENSGDNGDEIDEKYLTLNQGEICDIDIEEMDAMIKKKQDPKTVFSCDKCNKSFKFFKCLRKHKHWHDSQPEIFLCNFCKGDNAKSFEFGSLKTLNNHIQKKHLMTNERKFKCDICNKILPSHGQLSAHYKKVHDDSNAACQTCGKIFKNKIRLKEHLKVHQDERPYVCDLCGQSFKWSNAFKVHIQWHKQEKNFLCSECGKKFTSKKNLIEHLNIHSGRRPYTCEKCSASFVQLSAYMKHLHLHNEGNLLHKCDKCNKTFSHAYILRQHLLKHTSFRPYVCSTCHRSFKSQSNLCVHIKIHQDKQYSCSVCGEKFALLKTLKDHMVRHTGVKHKCPVSGCGKSYTQRFTLTKHFSKQHPSLRILRKKGGKRTHLPDKGSEKESCDSSFISYEFVEEGVEEQLRIG